MEYSFKKHKILMLDAWGTRTWEKYNNIKCYPIYVDMKGISRKKFKLAEHVPAGWFDMSQWYNDWKYDVENYDTIFIFDGIRGRDVIEYIRDKNPTARIIFYFYNPLDRTDRKSPNNYQDLNCEFYTFDPVNAKEWNMPYKYYYYDNYDYAQELFSKNNSVKQAIFFAGMDKGRLPLLINLKKKLAECGLEVNFHVLPSRHIKYSAEDKKYLKDFYLDSRMSLEEASKSQAIMEMQQDEQSGITLRVMAAMLLKKKVITFNENIKNFDLYHPNNILVIDKDIDAKIIKDFLAKPYSDYPKEYLTRFMPEIWLETFFDETIG